MAFLKQKQVAFKFKGDGIIIFQDVAQAIRAEKLMKRDGYEVRLIAPPPEYRVGCDLSLEIDLAARAEGAEIDSLQ